MTAAGRRAAVVGVYNTRQARKLEGETPTSLLYDAVHGALADAGVTADDIDGINAGGQGGRLIYDLRLGPCWQGTQFGLNAVLEAAAAIRDNQADVVLIASAEVGVYTERTSTAPWTRPGHEFIQPWGMFTTAEFALIARRHMHTYGTTPDQLARDAATTRNNGSANPHAVYRGRGPFTPEDILESPMVADPYHRLDCAMTSEGGCGLVLAADDRAGDLPHEPVYVLAGGADYYGPSYRFPPAWDLRGRSTDVVNGEIGRRAADRAFAAAGLEREDIDVLELYDPFSFEIIRQLEAFGFCAPGEGGPFVEDGHIEPTGSHPITTDGGTMSYSHPGANPQMLQRVIRAVQQVRGECASNQVPGARTALCSNGGAGAMFTMLALLGADR